MASAGKVIVNETLCVEDRVTFIWKIHDFSVYFSPYADKPLNSKKFTFKNKEFNLCMYCESRISINYLVIKLITESDLSKLADVKLLYRVALETKYYDKKYTNTVSVNTKIDLKNYCTHMDLKRKLHLPNDCLTVECELMSVYLIPESFTENSKDTVSCSCVEDLSCDLKHLFSTKNHADVILKVDNEEIPAHIAILSARSSTFLEMFKDDTEENRNRVITVTDFTPSVMKYLLIFMYTGVLEELKDFSADLLKELYSAAAKYDVKELKKICLQMITTTSSKENAEVYSTVAFRHDDENMIVAPNKDRVNGLRTVHSAFAVPHAAGPLASRFSRAAARLFHKPGTPF